VVLALTLSACAHRQRKHLDIEFDSAIGMPLKDLLPMAGWPQEWHHVGDYDILEYRLGCIWKSDGVEVCLVRRFCIYDGIVDIERLDARTQNVDFQ